MRGALILLAALLASCASSRPPPQIITQEVRVPVPYKAQPGQKLSACGRKLRPVTFDPPAASGQFVVLDQPNAAALQRNLSDLGACVRAWRAWAAPTGPAQP